MVLEAPKAEKGPADVHLYVRGGRERALRVLLKGRYFNQNTFFSSMFRLE